MNIKRTSRFQFHLTELLLLLGLQGALCTFVLPLIFNSYRNFPPGPPYPTLAGKVPHAFLVIGSVSLYAGVGFVVWTAYCFNWPREKRNWTAMIVGLIMGVALPVWPLTLRSHMARGECFSADDCRGYCRAQEIYHQTPLDKDGILEYAMPVHDRSGLANKVQELNWRLKEGEYGNGYEPVSILGYIYKILKAQGPHAPGGKRSYITFDKFNRPRMTEGYAIVAAPAVYGDDCTVLTYIAGEDGQVYKCDFGNRTPEVFKNMTEFDPDPKVWEKH